MKNNNINYIHSSSRSGFYHFSLLFTFTHRTSFICSSNNPTIKILRLKPNKVRLLIILALFCSLNSLFLLPGVFKNLLKAIFLLLRASGNVLRALTFHIRALAKRLRASTFHFRALAKRLRALTFHFRALRK